MPPKCHEKAKLVQDKEHEKEKHSFHGSEMGLHTRVSGIPDSVSMEFSRQEYWSRLPFPPAGDLPHPGVKPILLVLTALAGGFFTTASPGKLCLELVSV